MVSGQGTETLFPMGFEILGPVSIVADVMQRRSLLQFSAFLEAV